MTLVYDGDCAFCCRCASWIRERSGIDMSAGSPEDLAVLELSVEDAKRSVWWIEDGVRLAGHAAIGKALRQVGGLWAFVGVLISTPPISWLAALVYRWVAANRHRFKS